jgi:hypothetical protein
MSYAYRNDQTGLEISLDPTDGGDTWAVSRVYDDGLQTELNQTDIFQGLSSAHDHFVSLMTEELISEGERLQLVTALYSIGGIIH